MTLADEILRKFAATPMVQSTVGVFVGMSSGLARVNVQDSTVDIRCDGWSPPVPGMPVRVEVVNGQMRVTGPSQALPARGTVTAVSGGGTSATVDVGVGTYTLPVMAPYSPVETDVVVINWMSGHILGEEAEAPASSEPGAVGGGGTSFSELLITPTASGKYDSTWNNWWAPPEVWASDNNKGIWVYGGRFSALAGANIATTEFCFPTPIRAAGAAYIGLHGYPAIPGGPPTITDLIALSGPQRTGWYRCPDWWGGFLRDNPQCGIGVTSGAGDNRWPGVGQAGGGQSGWMRFSGTR